jgi:hypothetical protein
VGLWHSRQMLHACGHHPQESCSPAAQPSGVVQHSLVKLVPALTGLMQSRLGGGASMHQITILRAFGSRSVCGMY